jgi:hypothetical protein
VGPIRLPPAEDRAPNPVRKPMTLPTSVLTALVILLALVALLPAVSYYKAVFGNAINMPYQDDFDTGLQFVNDFTFNANTIAHKLRLIFSQHNEHRIVLNRIAALVDYWLFGQLNLRHLILFGNLSLLFLLWLFFQAAFTRIPLRQKLFYFLPVPFMLFQMHYWVMAVWGTGSVQNLYVFVFSLLSFYAIERSAGGSVWFKVACATAVMAAFTSGNGMFTFLAGIPAWVLTKQYRRLGIWVGLGAAVAGLYFWSYETPGHHPPLLGTLIESPAQFFDHFFALTGSDFSLQPDKAILSGRLVLALFIGLLVWNAHKWQLTANLTILMLLTFVYVTCLSVTAARSGYGITQATESRYGIFPVMLLVGLYLLAVETAKNRYVKPAVTLVGLGLGLYLYDHSYRQHFCRVEDRSTNLFYSAALYNDNPNILILYYSGPRPAKAMFLDAVKKGVYKVPPVTLADLKSPPQQFDGSILPANVSGTKSYVINALTLADLKSSRPQQIEGTVSPQATNVIGDVKPYAMQDYLVFYQSWVFLRGIPADQTQIRVVARGKNYSYAFDVRKQLRDDVVKRYESVQYLQSGFSCTIDKRELQPGRYTLWLALTGPTTQAYVPLNATFDV